MGEDLPIETNIPGGGGGVAATNMLMGSSSVTKSEVVPLSASEYFTPPTNAKEYDGKG